MQVSTTKEALISPLTLVTGASDSKSTSSMLSMVLLKAQKGKLTMLCSDASVLARSSTACDVGVDGVIAVDAKRLGDLVRSIPDNQSLDIRLEENGLLLVKSGRSRFRLPSIPADQYPLISPEKAERISITLPAKRLGELLDHISDTMAMNDIRYFMNGVLVTLKDGALWFVSTDGHRMTVACEPIAGADGLDKLLILPRKTALLARKFSAREGEVKITLGPRDVQFTFSDGTLLMSGVLEGKFPDWKKVIPKSSNESMVDSIALRDGLSMMAASIEATDKAGVKGIDVNFSKSMLVLSHAESARSEIDCEGIKGDGKNVVIGINIDYLLKAVRVAGTSAPKVRIGFSLDQSPITVKPESGDYPLVVVMPYKR